MACASAEPIAEGQQVQKTAATPDAAADAWYGYYGHGSMGTVLDYTNFGYGVQNSDSQYGRYGLFVCLFILLLS